MVTHMLFIRQNALHQGGALVRASSLVARSRYLHMIAEIALPGQPSLGHGLLLMHAADGQLGH